jgi:selenocysteine-specific translation elongation factor
MQVIATAGHVDHGKSTLLKALTGMDPDRWSEEKRRGLTIDLGFAWLRLPSGERIAFVDVPGHERFVPNMLAGVGPVPAVLFMVAADAGWMPQSAEHLAVLDALGIRRGLLVITRSDLADPGPAQAQASAEIGRSRLGPLPAVAVSAVTGDGLPELVAALDELAASLPEPDPGGPVRLWVDRAFSMTGSGTVVTGTLPAGTVHRADELVVTPAMRPVRVREIQTLGESAPAATGVARVALNLRGVSREHLARGMAIVQAGRWTTTDVIDVRLCGPLAGPAAGPASTDPAAPAAGDLAAQLPRTVTLHIGSARTVARVRPLAGAMARLSLRDPLPLHAGDRVLLRDPGVSRPVRRRPVPSPLHMVPRQPVPAAVEHADDDPADDTIFDAEHADAGHADADHADLGHTDGGHTDLGHTDAEHADAEHTDLGHTDLGHTDLGHTGAEHAEAGHIDAGHADTGHADAGLADPATASRAHANGGPTPASALASTTGSSTTGSSTTGLPTAGLPTTGSPAAAAAAWPGVAGAVVLDVTPPPLTRRGAAAAAARELATWPDQPGATELLRRHGLLRASSLLAMGVREHPEPVAGEWLADPAHWAALAAELGEVLAAHAAREPLAPGLPLEAARAALGLPDRRLVAALVRSPLRISGGLVQLAPSGPSASGLPEPVQAAVRILRADLEETPFAAPDADRLRKLGLDVRALAAAARAGLLLRISDQIVLAPGADEAATAILAGLPQPFTAADARQALGTTRRTAIPLLEYLDRAGVTERLPDDRRRVSARPVSPSADPATAGTAQPTSTAPARTAPASTAPASTGAEPVG